MKCISIFLLAASLGLISCSDKQRDNLSGLFQAETTNDFATLPTIPEAMNEENFWNYFVGTYMDASYSGYIKFSIELDDQGDFKSLIWHPSTFAYHADYLTTLPAYAGLSRAQIDAIALRDQGRKLLLGTALAVKDEFYANDQFDFQFVGEDPLTPALVAKAIHAVRTHLPKATAEKSFYLPAPTQLAYAARESASFAAAGVKFAQRQLTDDRVCYATGWGVGYVKKLDAEALDKALAEGSIQADDFLVLESIPTELPSVAGIVIASPSSPSSHPALLAQMLGIPYYFEKDAMTNKVWAAYAESREPVFVSAKSQMGQGCEVLIRDSQSLTPDNVTQLLALKKPQALKLLPYDSSLASAPVSLDTLGMNDGSRIGAKAANVAELRRVIPAHTIQEGLALPLTAFARFLASAKAADGSDLKPRYEALLAQLSVESLPLSDTLPLLTELRTLIDKAKISDDQASEILSGIEASFPKGTRIKLRSSSNMEDLPEFNGAGLYESKGACVGDDSLASGAVGLCEKKRDEVLKAVKKVWASLYAMKAWVARRTFGINEANVGMGVLIQRSFQDELANGVAIAHYPENTFFPEGELPPIEVMSSGFPGEDDSVANPPSGKIPETTRLLKDLIEVTVASTEIPRGQKLLSDAAYHSLFNLIETIYRHYESIRKPSDPYTFVLDLEWKLIEVDGVERVIIKQVRPVPSPSQSTQGLGFGSMIVGEKKALLCPSIQEDADALAKLKLSFPLSISVGLHEIKLDDSISMSNPITGLSVDGQALALAPESNLLRTEWTDDWASANESRSVTLSTPITHENQSYDLSWNVKQVRAKAEKNRLLDGVQSLWPLDFFITQGDKRQAYVLVLGQNECDSDTFQGLTPGAYNASLSYAQGRKPPVDFFETYASVTDAPLDIAVKARTSFQGFDKTRFLGIQEVTISGILDRPLVLGKGSSAYAPAHHNFQWAYAFDMDQTLGLSEGEKKSLRAKGIRYILLDNPGEQFGFPMPFPEGEIIVDEGAPVLEPEPEIVESAPQTFKVYGVDEEGTRVEIGEVSLVSRTDPFPIR